MKLSESVKPISYLKSHTAEALRSVNENQQTMMITQHGEDRAVLQDIVSYEQTQESLALLKMLAQSPEVFRRTAVNHSGSLLRMSASAPGNLPVEKLSRPACRQRP